MRVPEQKGLDFSSTNRENRAWYFLGLPRMLDPLASRKARVAKRMMNHEVEIILSCSICLFVSTLGVVWTNWHHPWYRFSSYSPQPPTMNPKGLRFQGLNRWLGFFIILVANDVTDLQSSQSWISTMIKNAPKLTMVGFSCKLSLKIPRQDSDFKKVNELEITICLSMFLFAQTVGLPCM